MTLGMAASLHSQYTSLESQLQLEIASVDNQYRMASVGGAGMAKKAEALLSRLTKLKIEANLVQQSVKFWAKCVDFWLKYTEDLIQLAFSQGGR